MTRSIATSRSAAKVYYRVEVSRDGVLLGSFAACGYRPTVHRNAAKLLAFLDADVYLLRRVRDGKALDRRELTARMA